MANFGDQLRSAPQEAAKQKAQAAAAEEARWQALRDQRERELRAQVAPVIDFFKKQSMQAARAGYRQIDCVPDASNVTSSGALYYKPDVLDVFFSNPKEKLANDMVPYIEQELSTMGLRSYKVSVVGVKKHVPPYTNHYLAFRIQASW